MPTASTRSIEQRFWEKAIPEPNSGCWLWTGAINANGYGQFGVGSRSDKTRRSVTASRFAYELTFGKITGDDHVLHKCDTPACINPDHLQLGSRSQNMQDAYDRHRQPFRGGSLNGRAKLTEQLVLEIRASNKTAMEWAAELGLSRLAVAAARNGKTWRHI